jgi:glycosyltransferase involved in cell wall biosynthesis
VADAGLALTVVIPAHNEATRLVGGRARLDRALDDFGADRVEVVVVDDGSSDATLEVLERAYGSLANLRVVSLPENRGKGAAIRLGLRVATAPLVITADADMAIDPRHFVEVADALGRVDFAPGSRAVHGRIVYDSRSRTLAGATFSRFVRHYARTPVRDTQCGCKGYRLGVGRLLALLAHVEGFAIDVEFFHLAALLGLRVEPVPVTWSDVTGSSVRPRRVAREMVRDLRGLRRTRYVNPAVVVERGVEVAAVAEAARRTRLVGLVVARAQSEDRDDVIVLGRDDALAGAGVAAALGGILTTTTPRDLTGRRLDPV